MSHIGIAHTGLSRDGATGDSPSGELPVLEEKLFYCFDTRGTVRSSDCDRSCAIDLNSAKYVDMTCRLFECSYLLPRFLSCVVQSRMCSSICAIQFNFRWLISSCGGANLISYAIISPSIFAQSVSTAASERSPNLLFFSTTP